MSDVAGVWVYVLVLAVVLALVVLSHYFPQPRSVVGRYWCSTLLSTLNRSVNITVACA